MAGRRDYDQQRLAELALYAAKKSEDDPRFGSTKLNKILFYSDYEAYRRRGASITGAVYQHLDQGPCPHQLLPALDSLRGSVRWERQSTYAGTQRRLVPLRKANTRLFEKEELEIVDSVIDELKPLTNKQASDLSHETLSWRLTTDTQVIPYGTALLSNEAPSEDDLAWLEGVAAEDEAVGVPAR